MGFLGVLGSPGQLQPRAEHLKHIGEEMAWESSLGGVNFVQF